MENVRIDKWLWAARFFKTTQLAIKALKNSQIRSHRLKLKPASSVQVGDLLTIQRGIYELEIEVVSLSDKRGPAKVAQTLYQETSASQTRREQLKRQLESQPKIDFDRRKPDKRALRSTRAMKRNND